MAVSKAEKDVLKVSEKVEKDVLKANRDSVTVTYRGGVRTYTREVHGDDFAKLAKEFAEKCDGTVA